MRRFLPKTIVGQLIAVLTVVLIIAQALNMALLVGSQRIQQRSNAYQSAIEHSVRLISQLPENLPEQLPYELNRERGGPQGAFFLSEVNRADHREGAKPLSRYNTKFLKQLRDNGITPLSTSVTFSSEGPSRPSDVRRPEGENAGFPPPRTGDRPPPRADGLYRPESPPPFERDSVALGSHGQRHIQEIFLSAEIREGVWFNAMIPHLATESFTGRILLITTLLLMLALAAAWVFSRRISKPISDFAAAAERLGRGEGPQRLEESGPQDLRTAAHAFNVMQTRLTRTLETQRNMLRAVGHDLRTPLTSLRIRAEMIPEEVGKEKIIATLDDMTVMTEEILGWAKDTSGLEDTAIVDLGAFLNSLVDDYQDEGQDVKLRNFETLAISIRRTSIKRALQNLINNALQYGHSAVLSVETLKNDLMIHIDDEGPGIPEDSLDDVRLPFARLETSRSKDTGGTGLGLSIVETIAQTHGGNLLLSNRSPSGLRATLKLAL